MSAHAALLMTLAVISPPAIAQPSQAVHVIGSDHPSRRSLLDALRPSIETDLGQPVQFVVQTLKVQDGWAFAVVRPQRPDGQEIDFRQTRYGEYMDGGIWDGPTTYALLRIVGSRWRVVDFVIGPTDVAWDGWPQEYGAPHSLLTLD